MTNFQDFLHKTSYDDIPQEVIDFSRRCLLDLVGILVSGKTTELSKLICNHSYDQFGAGSKSASILLDGREVSPAGAALANGMTIDAIDAHDGYKPTKGHIGCHVLPTLLAMCEAEGKLDGQEFLKNLILGYEIGGRAGIALHASVPDYHTSGAWGAVTSAALGARILELDEDRTRHAIGIGEYHGPRSQMMRCIDHPTMLKDGSGWGAMAGVSAAYLAQTGFTGAPAITVEGDHNINTSDISFIEAHTFAEGCALATREPQNTEQAQYSLPFPVAASLVYGKLGAEEVSHEKLFDAEVLRLSNTMKLIENDKYNAAFPEQRYAHVVIELTSVIMKIGVGKNLDDLLAVLRPPA